MHNVLVEVKILQKAAILKTNDTLADMCATAFKFQTQPSCSMLFHSN